MIVAGEVTQLEQGLLRLTAPNPGLMTGAGTNTYIVGKERLVVVDPGPAIDSHIAAIHALVGDKLDAIVVTHTHPDHSPAALPLAKLTGAPMYGALSCHKHFQDTTFTPDYLLEHDELVPAGDMPLRAIHTPGHVDNHYCLLVETLSVMLVGDHLMQGSTVVIAPPQGDMADYIASLQCMLDCKPRSIAPAHGELLLDPSQEVAGLIAHRIKREEKIYALCQRVQEASTDELLPQAYDDVDASLLPIARYSLLAHLLKLEKEQRVVRANIDAQQARERDTLDSAATPWRWRYVV